ncbi:MAG TPA: hypothetical protein PLD20_30800 [Blastocatellia bacterium]|nr:hypothetical protein [Blastocatellia bacterium]HMV82647.1 hypothetical protein [Blastocatellia bacterium]HMX29666.1 hypothetical protein [Blastocatellia bacterium]HMY72452.1 hypothetical protein [Blastocatellia bacterium]HMZ22361.1 hypothetical protein [Blastocatellia bacterium]
MAASKLALLESRVATLEAEMQQLKAQGNSNGAPAEDWVDRIYGLFADYPDFDEVIRLGREYRESLRPKPKKKKAVKTAKRRSR